MGPSSRPIRPPDRTLAAGKSQRGEANEDNTQVEEHLRYTPPCVRCPDTGVPATWGRIQRCYCDIHHGFAGQQTRFLSCFGVAYLPRARQENRNSDEPVADDIGTGRICGVVTRSIRLDELWKLQLSSASAPTSHSTGLSRHCGHM